MHCTRTLHKDLTNGGLEIRLTEELSVLETAFVQSVTACSGARLHGTKPRASRIRAIEDQIPPPKGKGKGKDKW